MPQRKVGPATPRRAAAPRPHPWPFSIVCPRGGSGRAWERSHRLLPTGVRSPRHRGAVIARVRVSKGRPQNAAAAPRGRDAPHGETAARVGAAAGTEQSWTRGTCGGAGAARGRRERRAENAGTSAPARHVLRGLPAAGTRKSHSVSFVVPQVSVSESSFPARARGPGVRGVPPHLTAPSRRAPSVPPEHGATVSTRGAHGGVGAALPAGARQRRGRAGLRARPAGSRRGAPGGGWGAARGGSRPHGREGRRGGAAGPFHS